MGGPWCIKLQLVGEVGRADIWPGYQESLRVVLLACGIHLRIAVDSCRKISFFFKKTIQNGRLSCSFVIILLG